MGQTATILVAKVTHRPKPVGERLQRTLYLIWQAQLEISLAEERTHQLIETIGRGKITPWQSDQIYQDATLLTMIHKQIRALRQVRDTLTQQQRSERETPELQQLMRSTKQVNSKLIENIQQFNEAHDDLDDDAAEIKDARFVGIETKTHTEEGESDREQLHALARMAGIPIEEEEEAPPSQPIDRSQHQSVRLQDLMDPPSQIDDTLPLLLTTTPSTTLGSVMH